MTLEEIIADMKDGLKSSEEGVTRSLDDNEWGVANMYSSSAAVYKYYIPLLEELLKS